MIRDFSGYFRKGLGGNAGAEATHRDEDPVETAGWVLQGRLHLMADVNQAEVSARVDGWENTTEISDPEASSIFGIDPDLVFDPHLSAESGRDTYTYSATYEADGVSLQLVVEKTKTREREEVARRLLISNPGSDDSQARCFEYDSNTKTYHLVTEDEAASNRREE